LNKVTHFLTQKFSGFEVNAGQGIIALCLLGKVLASGTYIKIVDLKNIWRTLSHLTFPIYESGFYKAADAQIAEQLNSFGTEYSWHSFLYINFTDNFENVQLDLIVKILMRVVALARKRFRFTAFRKQRNPI